jgi:hypothetical protein
MLKIYEEKVGKSLECFLLVTDSELALRNCCRELIKFELIKNCNFHFQKNTRGYFMTSLKKDYLRSMMIRQMYHITKFLPFINRELILEFIDFLKNKNVETNYFELKNKTDKQRNREVINKIEIILNRLRTRFSKYGELLNWDELLTDRENFVDKTTNSIERLNGRIGTALKESRKIRKIDRIKCISEEFHIINLEFRIGFRKKVRKVSKKAMASHQQLIDLKNILRLRKGKQANWNRVIELILEDFNPQTK